jgi:hypothetical protein
MADDDHSCRGGAYQRLSEMVFYAENHGFETDRIQCIRFHSFPILRAVVQAGRSRATPRCPFECRGHCPGTSFKDDVVKHRQQLMQSNKHPVFVIYFFKKSNLASVIQYYTDENAKKETIWSIFNKGFTYSENTRAYSLFKFWPLSLSPKRQPLSVIWFSWAVTLQLCIISANPIITQTTERILHHDSHPFLWTWNCLPPNGCVYR